MNIIIAPGPGAVGRVPFPDLLDALDYPFVKGCYAC